MCNTLVILAVTFCAVNAAYLVNVYDDGQEPLSTEAVSTCDYRACDQLCRRLGFPGGACVGDRCQCDNFVQAQEVNEITVAGNDVVEAGAVGKPEVENQVLLHDDLTEVKLRSSIGRASCDCIARDCDNYCFRKYFRQGLCLTGQCRCV